MLTYSGTTRWNPVLAALRLSLCALGPVLALVSIGSSSWTHAESPALVLSTDDLRSYVATFNAADSEDVVNLIPNDKAFEWIVQNAPLFDCPSIRLEEVYCFRWWTYRKHIKQTPDGRVLTEFILPVSHAGPFNTISCAFGHQVAEGRWLRDGALLDEYTHMWFRSGPGAMPPDHFHKFSSWAAAALYERYCATGDSAFLIDLLDDLVADYRDWEVERQLPNGLYYQFDVRDGMEESISGGRHAKNIRPTINCYMVANARAIAAIAKLAGRQDLADEFTTKSDSLRELTLASLWDADAEFFKVRLESGAVSDAREAIGYIPWMFGVAGREHAAAWRQVNDHDGFWAPAGLTTAERRHPGFRKRGTGTCEWDGAVWPFATSQTLVGMANLLRGPEQNVVTRRDYLDQLLRYASSHQQNGETYIGEYLDETTGAWLITGPKAERSRFYNHSTFCDLVIGGLVGIVPHADSLIEVSPVLPEGTWDWFCLDGVPYHGHSLTVIWDKLGERYGRGAGLSVWCDRKRLASRAKLGRLTAELPANEKPKPGNLPQ